MFYCCPVAALIKSFLLHSLLFFLLPFPFITLPPAHALSLPCSLFLNISEDDVFSWLPGRHCHQLWLVRCAKEKPAPSLKGRRSLVQAVSIGGDQGHLSSENNAGGGGVGRCACGVGSKALTPAGGMRGSSASGGYRGHQSPAIEGRTVQSLRGGCFLYTKQPHPGSTSEAGP